METAKNDEIKMRLTEIHEDLLASLSIMKYWTPEFKQGLTRNSTKVTPGCPKEIITSEIIKKAHHIVMKNRRMKIETTETVGITFERVQSIWATPLDMSKLSARKGSATAHNWQ